MCHRQLWCSLSDYDMVQAHFRQYYISLLGTESPPELTVDPMVIAEGLVLDIDQQLLLLTEISADMVKAAL